jgi:tetratricopeptide (TPR) repeat protein
MGVNRQLVTIAVLVFASCAATAQTSGKTVRHRSVPVENQPLDLSAAEAAIAKEDFGDAEALLHKAVAAEPANYAAWFDLGFVYNALGKNDESIAAYRKSVEAKPDVFESNLNLGLMLVKAGLPDAEKYLRAATSLKPTSHAEEGQARAWMSLAHVLAGSKPDEAIAAYRHVSTLQPQDPEPHLEVGALLEKQNQFADAEQEYKRAVALAPSSSDAYVGMANIYMRGSRFLEAEEILRKLVTLRPDDAGAHMQLGRVLAASSKNDEAISELQAALKISPADFSVQRDLADVYSQAGKYELAEREYRALLTAEPKDAVLHASLGRAFLKQRKFPEAETEFIAAVQLKPDLAEVYGDLANAADQNKNYPLAIKALDVRAKLLPEPPLSFFMRATAYDHLRDYKQASVNYHRFLEASTGQNPDQEWQARHRLIAIEPKKK